MIYGYLRVSTDEQDVNSQKQGVDSFAESKGWRIEKYITDEGISGAKDPDKRKLGPLLNSLVKDDIIICSEISRLGRDLYMVMDILHFCMERGCRIYTVKDNFTLGDDIQSKVLAFAFGLSAEIERQMIRQRTREGLRRRVKLGVLLGRPSDTMLDAPIKLTPEQQELMKEQFRWGVPQRRIAENFGIDRNTCARWLTRWGLIKTRIVENEQARRNLMLAEKIENLHPINDIDRNKMITLINADLTIPQIHEAFGKYTYDEIYDTILVDKEFNKLYRHHGQLKLTKNK